MRSFATVLIMLASVANAAPLRAADPAKLKVPDDPSQAKAETLIKQVFKSEYANSASPERRAFAKKLLEQSRDDKTEPAARFVLLREARNIAAASGDVTIALRAVDELEVAFAIDAITYRAAVITAAGKSIDNEYEAYSYISAGIATLEQMTAAQDFAGAAKLMQPISNVAAQLRKGPIINGVRVRITRAKEAKEEFDRLSSAMNRPPRGDPNGDLAGGKFACFFKDDWQIGLGRLAKCNEAAIREAAKKDLANPKTPQDRMAAANAWFEAAQKQTPHTKIKFEARARQWYRQAMPAIGGLDKALAEKRIAASLGAPSDATFFQHHAYAVSPEVMSWNEAKLHCELIGGHLAYVESAEEWEFMVKFATGPSYWLGATDQNDQGNWRWLNGAALTFTAWHRGQPDNNQGMQHFLACFNAGWDDAGRGDRHSIICEWE